jgi:hypothetical protein
LQRQILAAMAATEPAAWGIVWDHDRHARYPADAPEGGGLVWPTANIRRAVAQAQGQWCWGSPHRASWRWTRQRAVGWGEQWKVPHPPHPTWTPAATAAFSRALHRLVTRGVLWAVNVSPQLDEVHRASVWRAGGQIDFVSKR